MDVWFQFFQKYSGNSKIQFILIGDDEIDQRIQALPNVCRTRDFGSYIITDLGFIQCADYFMSMASGPCNMALFSKTPYLILKDPDHHTLEMKKEIGDKDQYIFAQKNQYIIREYQSAELLQTYFQKWFDSSYRT